METLGLRTWAEINLENFKANLKLIKNYIGNDVDLLAVIKADGYGHGAAALAKVCEENEVDHFAVACVNEGVELRKSGIKSSLLVLSYIDDNDIDKIIEYDLLPTVFDLDFATKLNNRLVSFDKISKIHIKLDTGMTRLGFDANDVDNTVSDIIKISKLSNIVIEGIFTHFADSDNPDLSYCNLQYDRYINIVEKLSQKGVNIPVKHTCNSAGVIACREKYLNMVRCGIMLYGYYPKEHLKSLLPGLKPFLSWKAKISQIREVGCDTPVSYGRTQMVKKGTKLAVVCVGYADGYNRRLSGDFYVLVNGKKAPIIGRVCMDQMMVDVSDIPDAKKGDTVTLLGVDGESAILADDFANKLGTISYEVLCNIGRRVPRFYR